MVVGSWWYGFLTALDSEMRVHRSNSWSSAQTEKWTEQWLERSSKVEVVWSLEFLWLRWNVWKLFWREWEDWILELWIYQTIIQRDYRNLHLIFLWKSSRIGKIVDVFNVFTSRFSLLEERITVEKSETSGDVLEMEMYSKTPGEHLKLIFMGLY